MKINTQTLKGKVYVEVVDGVMVGDIIVCQGQTVKVERIVNEYNGGLKSRECEFYDSYNNYRMWKEWADGGAVWREKSKVKKQGVIAPNMLARVGAYDYIFIYEDRAEKDDMYYSATLYSRWDKASLCDAGDKKWYKMKKDAQGCYIEPCGKKVYMGEFREFKTGQPYRIL